jgi:hypothetical protein
LAWDVCEEGVYNQAKPPGGVEPPVKTIEVRSVLHSDQPLKEFGKEFEEALENLSWENRNLQG